MLTTTNNANDTILAAALAYAARGWFIFPARFKRDKDGKWQKLSWKSAKSSNGRPWGMTSDPGEIRQDFSKPGRDAIGIPTGAINGMFVVETDTVEGHDVDGAAALKQLEAEHGALPNTLTAVKSQRVDSPILPAPRHQHQEQHRPTRPRHRRQG